MSKYKELLANYAVNVEFPDVSGFEILEMLQVRSRLAMLEEKLSAEERSRLEIADEFFLSHAKMFYISLSEIADLKQLRNQNNILPSHWWWYLDKLMRSTKKALAM